MMTTKLIAHFPSWMTDGIFHYLQEWAPWKDDESVSPVALDTEYLGNRSGDRSVSPLVKRLTWFKDDVILTDGDKLNLANIIRMKYQNDWQRLWDAIHVEYNPLENYSAEEIHTPGVTTTVRSNMDVVATSKANAKSTNQYKNESSVKGFGAAEFKPVTQSSGDGSTEQLEANNTGSTTQKADADKNYTETSHTGTDVMTRKGNIGVTTSQQMLESEYELRKRHYFDYVMECVDEVLTIPYWSI